MAANDGFGTLLLTGVEDYPRSAQPFDLGDVEVVSVQPFDFTGDLVSVVIEQPFYMLGGVAVINVQPFDLGSLVSIVNVQPFRFLGGTDIVLPGQDLGDGDAAPSVAEPILGWYSNGGREDIPGLGSE
jgi:hypothetical protein